MPERKKQVQRTRTYATVVYPESAPEDWKDKLAGFVVPCFISPLHDNDVNPTGEKKKPHYHVLVNFDGPKSEAQAKEFFMSFGGVGCEIVKSYRGYARYLCHLDNPDKAQYKTEEVISFAGADYLSVIGLPSDKYKSISEMIDFCMVNDIDSYSYLLLYASQNRYDWFRVLCDNGTMVIKEFLKSRSWDKRRMMEEKKSAFFLPNAENKLDMS